MTLAGGRRDVPLGAYDTSESCQAYLRVLAEWEANSRQLPRAADDLSINELDLRFLEWARTYYRQSLAAVAAALNAEGYRPPRRVTRYSGGMVGGLLARQAGAAGQQPAAALRCREWLLGDLARQLGMPAATHWRQAGWLQARKLAGSVRWTIAAPASPPAPPPAEHAKPSPPVGIDDPDRAAPPPRVPTA